MTNFVFSIIGFCLVGFWAFFNISLEGRDLPTLKRIATIGDIAIFIVCIVIIAKYNLWC